MPTPIRDVPIIVGQRIRHKTRGGHYEVMGQTSGAGVSRPEQRIVYVCLITGNLYHRTKYDFVAKMEPANTP